MAQQHNISSIEYPMTVGTTEQGPQKRYRRLRFPSFDADVWANKNPLLQKGELGHEKDTGRFKVGDGVTYWSDLPYNSVGDPAKVNGHNVLEIIAGKNVSLIQDKNVLTISAEGVGYSKQEIDNKFTVANAQIDANAVAIAKTRDDYMSADTDIMTIVNNHAEELTTLRGNQASLGDQVAGIEGKIPESASGTNHLITKQQLLDEEMDIRDDLNEMASELQTQITAQAAEIATKQDQLTAGDNIIISNNVISATGAGGGAGLDMQVVDQLPATGKKGVIYLVPKDSTAPDVYDEYVWIDATQTFELIGNTQVDLSDYATKEDLNTVLPDQTGNTGKFLTTDGSTASWSDKPLVNTAAGTNSLAVLGSVSDSVQYTTVVGSGASSRGGNNSTVVGSKSQCRYSSTLIGAWIQNSSAKNAVILGSGNTSQQIPDIEDNSVTWVLSGVEYKLFSADGTIPADRMSAVAGTTGQVLTKTDDGMAWQEASGGASLPDQTGNAGKVLTTDGETASWQEPSGGTTITLKEYDE